MRRPYTVSAIALGVCLAGVPVLQASITPVNYPTPMPGGSSVSGEVTNIDPVNRFVQIREASGMVQTVHVDEHIQLLHNGEAVNLNDIRLGDTVTAVSNR